MQPRRSLRLVAGALVLALPLLAGCGFNKATDRPFTPGAGTNDQRGEVDILSAVVVTAQPGSGTFVAALSNNTDEDAELSSVAGSGEWSELTIEASPVELAPSGSVNLLNEDPITVSGEFEPGDFVELTFTFGDGSTTTMDVPVVFACEEYTDLDASSEDSDEEPYDCTVVLEEE